MASTILPRARDPEGVALPKPSYEEETMSELMTRREALGLLGMTAAAAALPASPAAEGPTFPKGAIIRTILKDYAPEELAGGATLFHEHFQLATDFNAKF